MPQPPGAQYSIQMKRSGIAAYRPRLVRARRWLESSVSSAAELEAKAQPQGETDAFNVIRERTLRKLGVVGVQVKLP